MSFQESSLFFISNILSNTLIIGILIFIFKKWFERAIDMRYKTLEEKLKLKIEIDKSQALDFLSKQYTIYPEIIEIVYRLRNLLRDIKKFIVDNEFLYMHELGLYKTNKDDVKKYADNLAQFETLVFKLTENLYKYKAFLKHTTFNNLHEFKRKTQDASTLIDSLTRLPPNDSEVIDILLTHHNKGKKDIWNRVDIWHLNCERLEKVFSEIDKLQNVISIEIKDQLEKHIP